jgi:hypothetical protein
MSRRSLIMALLIVFTLAGATSMVLAFLLRHEPAFYVRGAIQPGQGRSELSKECISQFSSLLNGILNNKEGGSAQFSEKQINGYFQEDFITNHSSENPLPNGVSNLRVGFDPERLRLAFRYGKGIFSTVVSLVIRPWIVAREPNAVALEFESLHAGALPISAQWLLERISEAARQQHVDVSWYRLSGHPVVLLRFQADRPHPTFQLQRLQLREGTLFVSGRSLEGTASNIIAKSASE